MYCSSSPDEPSLPGSNPPCPASITTVLFSTGIIASLDSGIFDIEGRRAAALKPAITIAFFMDFMFMDKKNIYSVLLKYYLIWI